MPRKSSVPAPDDQNYSALLNDLKTRIRSAQIRAALAVNQELILLYWHIGREILMRQHEQGWGAKVIDQLSQDLKREFPEMKGFSRSNLKYMRAFAEAWPNFQIGQQVLANLPWTQNVALLEKLKDPGQRLWYAQQSLEYGWGRSILIAQIETGLYQREGGAVTNFEQTLPSPQSELAQQVIRDPYRLDFLVLAKEAKEQDLKQALVNHMRDFLVELGVGFCYVGKDYQLEIGNEEFMLDLLFYHLELRCFVIIDLRLDKFQAEYSGKMNLYISAVDGQMRKEYDQPTIGIILCKSKNKTIAEYALHGLHKPIAVATHQLPEALQDELPSPEQLQKELDSAVRMIEGTDVMEVEVQPDEINADRQSLIETALEVQRTLKLLIETNPTATEGERRAFVTLAIPATLRQRTASALDSASRTAIEGQLEATYADVAIAIIESWGDKLKI